MGKGVVIGRNTLQSLPSGKPLKNRVNIVLSGSLVAVENALVVDSHAALFQALKGYNTDDVFVIGGAAVYKDLLPHCTDAWVTKVFADGKGTHFFENLDKLANWELVDKQPVQEDNGYTFQVCRYKNKKIK